MPVLSTIFLFLIGLSVIYMLAAAWFTTGFFRSAATPVPVPDRDFPPVSVIKPVSGPARGDRENFMSFCEQDYPEFEIIFALQDAKDPVLPLLEELKRNYPHRAVQWIVADHNAGPNYKVGNLIEATRAARYDVLVYSDSDMRVGPRYLKTVVAPLLQKEAGLATCLYRNLPDNIWSALEALSVQTDFMPNVLFDRRRGGLSYAFGSTLAISRGVLDRIGGLEPLLDYLADDYQMGDRVSRAGLRVALAPCLLDHVVQASGPGYYFHHQLRAAVTHRVCRPAGYLASVITHGVTLSLLFGIVEGFSPPAVAVLLGVCGLRISSAAYLNRRVIQNRQLTPYVWLVPLNDLLSTLFWFLSFFVKTVNWKDRRFRISAGGKMTERVPS